MNSRYSKPVVNEDGWCDWFELKKKYWDMCCCDCGLVHRFEFKIVGNKIMTKCKRYERATGQKRRFNNYICKKKKP